MSEQPEVNPTIVLVHGAFGALKQIRRRAQSAARGSAGFAQAVVDVDGY